jgi:hypothetical protein
MFNTPSDVAVTLVADRTSKTLGWQLDGSSSILAYGSTPYTSPPLSDSSSFLTVVAGDFTGDGLDEIVAFLTIMGSNGFAVVATAADPQDPSKGLRFGPVLNYAGTNYVEPLRAAKATVLGAPRVFVAGPVNYNNKNCTSLHSGLQFESFTVAPDTLALASAGTFAATLPEGNTSCLHNVDITAGRFGKADHDQLAVSYGVESGNVKVFAFDLNEQGFAVQGPMFDTGISMGGGQAMIRGGRFDWSRGVDQAALLISNDFNATGINTVRILSFDSNLNATAGAEFQAGLKQGECVNDMAVGNFDRQQANSTPPQVDPNLQLAIPFTDCQYISAIRIFDVDPDKQFEISRHSPTGYNVVPGGSVFLSKLAAVDLQGRSLRLGTPARAVLENHAQPVVITGAPPMHVDYVTPIGKTAPQILNVSAIPDGFLAKYSLTDSTSQQSSSQHTTSWQMNLKVSASFGAYVGNCAAGECVDNNTTLATDDTWGGSVKDQWSTGSAETFNAAFSSQFGDYVRFDSTRVNLYLYPVLGKTVCPADKPNCADIDKVPVFYQFSAPDQATHDNVLGTSLEWYQPPWEPGNIFSYPGNEDQLKVYQTTLNKLSQDETFHTDKTPGTESTTWSANAGTNQTTGTSSNFNGSISTSTKVKGGFFQGGFSIGISGGQAQEGLTTSQTALGTSAGVELTKPGTFLDPPNYQYAYTPIIYGQDKPYGHVNQQAMTADIHTFGFLGTSYVVDPVTPRAGIWTDTYSSHPDVALNHPIRWQVTNTTLNPADGTCLPYNTSTPRWDCVALGTKLSPTVPFWDDEFHSLRGFFITSADTPGSLLQSAEAGDKITLGARVYNYSLKDMKSGEKVHVRFYGQQVDPGNYRAIGNSFLIGETTLSDPAFPSVFNGPICPFNIDTACPNWTIAWLDINKPFDTTPYSDKHLIFWVIAWMEDAKGQLVQELDNHGLTKLPPTSLASLMDAVSLEEAYSNNVGYFKFPFSVFS